MTAPNLELLPLIHRHLKEHGFLTAADELQKKLSPQDETPTSTTLLDIYTAWSKSSKRRKKPATSKKKPADGKKSTPKKERKKTNKTNKQSGSPNKKATPTKGKKDGGKNTKKVVKPNKSDVLDKKAADGEDSDSSLDEEKWKKLVREMTDTDLIKVEAFNALIAPEPKKQRVRKPRAKPKPKTETSINDQDPQNAKLDKSPEDILAKSNPTKKSRAKKAAPVAALNSSNKEQHVETPDASVISTTKQSSKKQKRKASNQASLEPKHKKKKVTIKNNVSPRATDGDDCRDKIIDNRDTKLLSPTVRSPENTPNLQTEPKKKKKKRTTENATENVNGDGIFDKNINDKNVKMHSPTQTELKEGNPENPTTLQIEAKKKKKKAKEEPTDSNVLLISNPVNIVEDLNGNLPPEVLTSSLNTVNVEVEPVVKVKKKKKKKDKAKDDGELVEAKTISITSVDTCEKMVEEASPNAAEVLPKKKKKKKDKNKEDSETLQQMETNVLDEAVHAEQNTEEIVVKKKSKKKKKQSEEHSGTEGKTPSTEGCEISEESPEPPSTLQTPGSKKKKQKLKSEKPEEADAAPPTLDGETPKKKKKTSSKSKETES